MASPSVDQDIEAQRDSATETQPAIIPNPPPATDTANPELPTSPDPQPPVANTNEHRNGNAAVQQTADISGPLRDDNRIHPQPPATSINEHRSGNAAAQQTVDISGPLRDDNRGDSSNGLWSMYLTEAEKEDAEVTESWNGDTEGILVFTGLFSATVAAFIIESYKMLSPDSADTTNAILTQLSAQLVNISNGTPLASVAAQSVQPFKPTASAVRVNILWFLSLILSLNCALSATLMQQWARRYRELAQRRGAFHRRGRMRAYIFDGINKFGMARAVATMPTLLHISVFLFFAGLVDFLFPIHTSVAYAAVGCIGVFALAYTTLTALPIIDHNCPYATPLSGFMWRISQFSMFVFLWTVIEIQCLVCRKPSSKLWRLANQLAPGAHRLEKWWKKLSRFIWSIPRVPVIVYNWAVQMIRGLCRKSLSKLRSLADRHAPETYGWKKWWKILSGFTRSLPHVPVILYNWTVQMIQGLYRKSLSKLRGFVDQRSPGIPGEKRWWEKLEKQVKIRRQRFSQSLRKSAEFSAHKAKSTVVTSALEWTLTALDEDKEIEDFTARVPGFFDSHVVPDATSAVLSLMSHQPNADPVFGSRLYDLLKTCIPETSILDETTRKNRLRVCMKCLWYFGKAYSQSGSSQVLPPYFLNTLASPEITHRVQAEEDPGVRMIGRCFGALIVNKLAPDLESRTNQISNGELACLSAILSIDSDDVKFLLREPGAVALANMVSLAFGGLGVGTLVTDGVLRDVPDVAQQTLTILTQALPAQKITELQLEQTIAIPNGIDVKFKRKLVSRLIDFLITRILVPSGLTGEVRRRCLRMCLEGLWYFGPALNQLEHSEADHTTQVIGRSVEALVINKLIADIKSRNIPARNEELAYLSAVLGTKSDDVLLLLRHPGAFEFYKYGFPRTGQSLHPLH